MATLRKSFGFAVALASVVFASSSHAATWSPMASISATAALVTNSLCYTDGQDLVCNGTGPAAGGSTTDRIVSGTSGVYVSSTGVITLNAGGANAGYLNSAGLVIKSVSATGIISATQLVANGGTQAAPGISLNNGLGDVNGIFLYAGNNLAFTSNGVQFMNYYGNSLEMNVPIYGEGDGYTLSYTNTSMINPIFTFRLNDKMGMGGDTTLGTLSLITSNTSRLAITSTGNVGIGIMTPTTALEVNGTISATGLRINGVSITGGGGGATTFASLTDVSMSLANGTLYGPGSTNGAVVGYTANTAYGINALSSTLLAGIGNSGYGYASLGKLRGGDYNTASGSNSMFSNTSGASNSAYGASALYTNTTGAFNMAIGRNTLYNNTADNNTAVGANALRYKGGGANNTGLGFSSGAGVDGSSSYINNSMLGAYTGNALTTGGSNTLIGYNAGAGITTGNQNLVIGAQTTPFSNTGSYQLNLANALWGDIGSGTGNANKLGINVTSPTVALQVSGTVSATRFVGDGSALTGIAGGGGGDRITSSTTAAVIANTTGGTVSFTLGSTSGAAYLHPALGLVVSGVSTTGNISASTLLSSGRATFNGGIQLNGGTGYLDNTIYAGNTTNGANVSFGFFAAGPGAQSASDGPYFFARGNNFSSNVGQQGSMIFAAGDATNGGKILFLTGSDQTRMFIQRDGNVGIGSFNGASANALLHVSGTALVNSINTAWEYGNTNTNGVTIGGQGSSPNMGSVQWGDGSGWKLHFGPAISTVFTPRITFVDTGRIGVGTATPTTALEVVGTISATSLVVNGVSITGSGGAGASTFASLTDVSYSTANGNMAATGSLKAGSTTGSTAFGISALSSAGVNGVKNTAFGANNLSAVTSGLNNTAIGSNNLPLITSAGSRDNVSIGTDNMPYVTGANATYNVAIGTNILNNAGATSANENVAIGAFALNSGSADNNVAIGARAMRYGTGAQNTVVGNYAGGSSGSARSFSGNAVFGSYAGQSLGASATSNTLIGTSAGYTLTTGSNNILIGYGINPYNLNSNFTLNIGGAITGDIGSGGTGKTNLIGINVSSPTAALEVSGTISATALRINGVAITGSGGGSSDNITSGTTSVTANNNTSVSIVTANVQRVVVGSDGTVGINQQPVPGYSLSVSGSLNLMRGNYSVFVGTNAGISYTTAWSNTGIGYNTLRSITNGGNNTAVGYGALYQVSSSTDNTAIGQNALNTVTSGWGNIGIGSDAGGITTGSKNIIIGTSLQALSNSASYQLNIGNAIFGDISSGNGNGRANKLGINVNSPTVALEVSGTVSATRFVGDGSLLTGISGGGGGDAITSGTTTVKAYNNTSVSVVTAGTERMVVGTTGLVGINQQPTAGYVLGISGSQWIRGRLNLAQTAANDSIFIGSGSSVNNTGAGVAAIGVDAATNNTGQEVVAVGKTAAYNNTGTGLIALGTNAGYGNTGSNAIFIGYGSGYSNVTPGNIGMGYFALRNNVGGGANTVIGYNSLGNSVNGSYNTTLGQSAAEAANSVTATTAIGAYAGAALTTGGYNTLLGFNAGAGITTGGYNIVIGQNTTPNSNTGTYQLNIGNAIWGNIAAGNGNTNMIGINVPNPSVALEVKGTISASALYVSGVAITAGGGGASTFASLTDVSSSFSAGNIFGPGSLTGANVGITRTTAFGQGALAAPGNTGSSNSAFGRNALGANTSGYFNTAIGTGALQSNLGGDTNSALGVSALLNNTTGQANTAIGVQSMYYNTSGASNVALGYNSLQKNTTGTNNVGLGNLALYYNTTGAGNIAIGSAALSGTSTNAYNVVIGNLAAYNPVGVSETIMIGNQSGYGTGSSLIDRSVFIGSYTGKNATTAAANIFIGYNTGSGITTGSSNTLIGTNVGPYSNTGNNQLNIANAIWGDTGTGTANANKIGINVTSPTNALDVSGTLTSTYAAIGTNTPGAYQFYVAGNAYSTGSWSTSDARFKENIQPMTGLLAKIDQLRPVTFTWKKTAFPAKDNPGEQIGLIAQEVEKIYPDLVKTNTDGYKAVAYDKLGVLLLGAVKDLKTENDALKAENTTLKAQQQTILQRLDALERKQK